MKKLLLLSAIMLLMVSCTTVKKTSVSVQIAPKMTQYPAVANLDVKDRIEKTTSWTFNPLNNVTLEQRKKNLIADVLLENNADVLVEPRYVHKVDRLFYHTLTVSGYPATYKNFRNVEESDIKVLYGEPPVTVINVLDSAVSASVIDKGNPIYTYKANFSLVDSKSSSKKLISKSENGEYSRGKGLGFHAGIGISQIFTLGVDIHPGDRLLFGAEGYLLNPGLMFEINNYNIIDGFTLYGKYYLSKRPFSVFVGIKAGMRFFEGDYRDGWWYDFGYIETYRRGSDNFFTVAPTIGLSYKHFDLGVDVFYNGFCEKKFDYPMFTPNIKLCYNFFKSR